MAVNARLADGAGAIWASLEVLIESAISATHQLRAYQVVVQRMLHYRYSSSVTGMVHKRKVEDSAADMLPSLTCCGRPKAWFRGAFISRDQNNVANKRLEI